MVLTLTSGQLRAHYRFPASHAGNARWERNVCLLQLSYVKAYVHSRSLSVGAECSMVHPGFKFGGTSDISQRPSSQGS